VIKWSIQSTIILEKAKSLHDVETYLKILSERPPSFLKFCSGQRFGLSITSPRKQETLVKKLVTEMKEVKRANTAY
jgi:hypothetical protein